MDVVLWFAPVSLVTGKAVRGGGGRESSAGQGQLGPSLCTTSLRDTSLSASRG